MSACITLLAWGARSIGPRVARLLLAQLVAATLVGGLATRLVAPLLDAMRDTAEPRAAALVALALMTPLFRTPLRHALCPASLASLRRQPLGDIAFASLALPWALPLAWPWAVTLGLGHPDRPAVVVTAWLAGAFVVAGIASERAIVARAGWCLVPLAVTLLVDRVPGLAWPLLCPAFALGAWLVGRAVRSGLIRTSSPARRAGTRAGRTPFGALLALDGSSLRASLRWLLPGWLPALGVAYLVVLARNGNCRDDCLDRAGIVVTALGAELCVAALGALRRVQGPRFLVPDRVVPTRLRLASLFVVGVGTLAPFVVALALLSGEPTLLPHACAVALATLLLQLRDPTRAVGTSALAWLLIPPTLVVLLPDPAWFAASTGGVLVLAALVDRRGAALRRELAAGSWASRRH